MKDFWIAYLSKKQKVLGSIAILLLLDLSQSLYNLYKVSVEIEKANQIYRLQAPNKKVKLSSQVMASEEQPKSSFTWLSFNVSTTITGMYFFKPLNYFLFGLSCKTCQGSWIAKYFPAYIDPVASKSARERIAREQEITNIQRLDEVKYGSSWDRFIELLPFSISRSCTTLAGKVIRASQVKAAETGGIFTEYGNLKEVLKSNSAIVCKGIFNSKGDLPMGEYTISEDKDGVYWKYSSGSLINEMMQSPEIQILRGLHEN